MVKAIPKVKPGYRRAWRHCTKHGSVAYRDFVPFSMSNPITVMPCGCDANPRFSSGDVVEIEEAAALAILDQRERAMG